MQIKVSIILLRSEKSVATWGLSTCLSMIWEDRLQRERGVEREGGRERKREAESEGIRLTKKKKKKPQKHKGHWVFLFYLSALRAGLLGSDLPNSLIHERQALILKCS